MLIGLSLISRMTTQSEIVQPLQNALTGGRQHIK